MKRAQFTFYRSYYEALLRLPKKDREPLVMAMIAYALDETEPQLTGTAEAIFLLIRPTLDTGRNKAANRCNKTQSNEKQNEKESDLG